MPCQNGCEHRFFDVRKLLHPCIREPNLVYFVDAFGEPVDGLETIKKEVLSLHGFGAPRDGSSGSDSVDASSAVSAAYSSVADGKAMTALESEAAARLQAVRVVARNQGYTTHQDYRTDETLMWEQPDVVKCKPFVSKVANLARRDTRVYERQVIYADVIQCGNGFGGPAVPSNTPIAAWLHVGNASTLNMRDDEHQSRETKTDRTQQWMHYSNECCGDNSLMFLAFLRMSFPSLDLDSETYIVDFLTAALGNHTQFATVLDECLRFAREVISFAQKEFSDGKFARSTGVVSCEKGRHRSRKITRILEIIFRLLGIHFKIHQIHNTDRPVPELPDYPHGRKYTDCGCGKGCCKAHANSNNWNQKNNEYNDKIHDLLVSCCETRMPRHFPGFGTTHEEQFLSRELIVESAGTEGRGQKLGRANPVLYDAEGEALAAVDGEGDPSS